MLAGDREYYAAVRAKEINPRAAQMVNAFIIPEDLEAAAIKQFAALHQTQIPNTLKPSTGASPPTETSITEQRLTNLESRLDAGLLANFQV